MIREKLFFDTARTRLPNVYSTYGEKEPPFCPCNCVFVIKNIFLKTPIQMDSRKCKNLNFTIQVRAHGPKERETKMIQKFPTAAG